MFFVKPPYLLEKLLPRMKWRMPVNEKAIYLTFDDGPIPKITPWVLEMLQQFNAKATFFCVGDNVSNYPDIYSEILEKSHTTGNHTYHHLNGWKTVTEEYIKNTEKCGELIHSSLFRPPYGKLKPSQYSLLADQYSIIMWDVLSGDYDIKIAKEKCFQNIVKNAKEGSIVVLHDSQKAECNLKYALPRVLEHFSKQGFEFKAIT